MKQPSYRTRTSLGKGDRVRFRAKNLHVYQQIYSVTEDDVFEVAHVEPRRGRRCLYLKAKSRETWIPAYPSSLVLAGRQKAK